MAQKALSSFQGSFGQYNEIMKHIEEHKKENALINYIIMKPMTTGKARVNWEQRVPLRGQPEGPKKVKT